jgi:hypothetical protein
LRGVARVRLCVPDARTATVFVQHAVDRMEDGYCTSRHAARHVGACVAAGGNELMDDEALKQLQKYVCVEELDTDKRVPHKGRRLHKIDDGPDAITCVSLFAFEKSTRH